MAPTLNELSLMLGNTLYDKSVVVMLARDHQISLALLDLDGPPVNWWLNALTLAHASQKLDDLLTDLRDTLPVIAQEIARPMEWSDEQPRLQPLPDGSPYDPQWDVGRLEAEGRILARLRGRKATTVLVAPDGYGKTWFLQRVCSRLRLEPASPPVVVVTVNGIGESKTEFFRMLASSILIASGQSAVDIGSVWKQRALPADNVWALLESIARNASGRIVLAFDVPNGIWRSKAAEAFFAMLRAIGNANESPWHEIQLLVTYSTTPSLWNHDITSSPLNVLPNELPELATSDVYELARRYNLSWTGMDLTAVHQSLGGHPKLLRQLMFHCHQTLEPVPVVLEKCDHPGELFFQHIQEIRALLEKERLMDELRRVAREHKPPSDGKVFMVLYAAGLIRRDPGRGDYDLRCGLLRRVIV